MAPQLMEARIFLKQTKISGKQKTEVKGKL
jgi:hypothetical protein